MHFMTYIKCARYIYSLRCLFYNESEKNIEYVKKCALECGSIGQKLLQFLVMQNGFFTSECKSKFLYIFEDCHSHSWEDTKRIYKSDFGREIEEDFVIDIESDDIVPIGSGSIGQVYKLYNRDLQEYIALKVRHVNIEIETANFIKNISSILDIANIIVSIPFSILIKEFLKNIDSQLDYFLETHNTNKIRINSTNDKHIIVPSVYFNSARIIAMSYHEGVSFIELTDEKLKSKIAADMFMFNLSSLLVHDLLHCDLHYGNWKVIESKNKNNPNDYKLLIYDCGIVGSTKNNEINQQICMACMDGDYNKVLAILTPNLEKQKNGVKMKEYTYMIMTTYYANRLDRMTDFLKKISIYKIKINREYLRCIQGLLTCLSILLITSEKLTKLLGKDGTCLEVFVCYYSGVLKRINKYPLLMKYLDQWIENDPNIEIVFYKWMEDMFGHQDKEVFIDAMLHKLMY